MKKMTTAQPDLFKDTCEADCNDGKITTTQVKLFEKACEKAGLVKSETKAQWNPFLKWQVEGFWVLGVISDRRIVKSNGYGTEQDVVTIYVELSSDATYNRNSYNMGLSGLLKYQLFDSLESSPLPCRVGICYAGKDKKGRHQTIVYYLRTSPKK